MRLNLLARFFLIHKSEQKIGLHFFLVFFLVGTGLALGRGSADTLFFKRYGIEYLTVIYLFLGLGFSVLSLIYASIIDRILPEKLLSHLLVVLFLLLLVSWSVMSFFPMDWIYPTYYLIYELYSEFLLLHIAFYLAQNFETLQLKRLSPIIFAGVQVGTITGGALLSMLATSVAVDNIILVWGGITLATIILTKRWHNLNGRSRYYDPKPKRQQLVNASILQLKQGLFFLRQSHLLRAIFTAIFFMGTAHFVLSFSVNLIYINRFTEETTLAQFFGAITMLLGFSALALQVFVSNRLINRLGVKWVNLLYPVTTLACFIALFIHPIFIVALLGSINKDIVRPVFSQPIRNLFFNALPSHIQGRARAMMLAIVLPLILIASSILISVIQVIQSSGALYLIGFFCTLLFFTFSLKMNKHYISGVLSSLKESIYIPEKQNTGTSSDDKEVDSGQARLESIKALKACCETEKAKTEFSLHNVASAECVAAGRLQRKPANAFSLIELDVIIKALFQSTQETIRLQCVRCFSLLPPKDATLLAELALEDNHPFVRDEAIRILSHLQVEPDRYFQHNIIHQKGSPRAQINQLNYLSKEHIAQKIFVEIALSKLDYADLLYQSIKTLKQHAISPREHLLPIVLEERFNQTISLCLIAMNRFENPYTILLINAGLCSRDRKNVARAVEALYHLDNKKIAHRLARFFDLNNRPIQTKSLDQVVEWCRSSADEWLQTCAQRFGN